MHCPNCGTKATASQKFCRACGFGLEKVEQLVAEQRTAITDQNAEATSGASGDRLRKLEKWAARALGLMGGILGGLLLWGIIFKIMIEKGHIFQGSIILMGLATICLYVFVIYRYYERKKEAAPARSNPKQPLPESPEALDTARTLADPNADVASSVTEQTTSKLEEKIAR